MSIPTGIPLLSQTPSSLMINSTESVTSRVFQSITLIVIFLGAVVLNALTIVIILRVRSLRQNYHNLLVLHLCVADLGVALASMTFSMISIFDDGHLLTSHDALCQINGFFTLAFSFTNFPLICSIGIDRLLTVVFTQRFPPTRNRILVLIVLSWITGCLIASTAAGGVLTFLRYSPFTKHCTPSWENDLYRNTCVILVFGLVTPSMIICYVIISYYLRKAGHDLDKHDKGQFASKSMTTPMTSMSELSTRSDNEPQTDETEAGCHHQPEYEKEGFPTKIAKRAFGIKLKARQHQRHIRVAKTGALLVLNTIACWVPYFLFHAGYVTFPEAPWYGVFTMWLGYCNALFDPLIYAFMNRRVRREIRSIGRRVSTSIRRTG